MMSTIIMVATARLASFNIKEIANMTGISKSLANKIRNTIHVKKNKYSSRCKLKEIKEKLGDKCPEIL